MNRYSDITMLKVLKNPETKAYEIKMRCKEITFLGRQEQPDFADVWITIYPNGRILELKSLKKYFYQFRTKIMSYERILNVIHSDLLEVCSPERLRLSMIFKPRGGISSKLTVDSDWEICGGVDKYKDWKEDDLW